MGLGRQNCFKTLLAFSVGGLFYKQILFLCGLCPYTMEEKKSDRGVEELWKHPRDSVVDHSLLGGMAL